MRTHNFLSVQFSEFNTLIYSILALSPANVRLEFFSIHHLTPDTFGLDAWIKWWVWA